MILLHLLAETPATAADLADRMFPFRGTPMPTERDGYFAWRSVRRAELAAWESSAAARTRKVSRALGKLQERGLVETFGPPRIAGWFVARSARMGAARALAMEHPNAGESLGRLPRYLDMIAEVGSGPPGVRELTRTTARERRYARLVRMGVIEPPTLRRLTFAGLQRVRPDLRRVVSAWHRWTA